jgi:hypothetical protein
MLKIRAGMRVLDARCTAIGIVIAGSPTSFAMEFAEGMRTQIVDNAVLSVEQDEVRLVCTAEAVKYYLGEVVGD